MNLSNYDNKVDIDFIDLFIMPAKAEDFEFYFQMKCEKENIYWSGYKSAPDKEKLHTWFMQKVAQYKDKYSYKLYIILARTNRIYTKVGYLSLYPSCNCKDCCEISIGVSSSHTGKGIGTKAIKRAIEESAKLGYKKIFAYIRKDNIRSQAAFTKAGFILTERSRKVFFKNINCDVEMWEYVYDL